MDDKTIFAQFQHISNKLKKRSLLKKPNLAEISVEFENLGVSCEVEDLPQYAGLCYKAAADCQKSLGNASEQAFILLKASRQFLSSCMGCISHEIVWTDENLNEALSCYRECLDSFASIQDRNVPNISPLLGGIRMEMADFLRRKLRLTDAAVDEYLKALALLDKSPVEKISCLEKLISTKIELGHYDEALQFTNELVQEANKVPGSGFRKEIMQTSEITRILLLLILEPTPQQLPPPLGSILEKYAWVEMVDNNEIADLQTSLTSNGGSILDEKLFVCLQSLVMTCQYSDMKLLNAIEIELLPYLSIDQQDLMRVLIKKKLKI